MKKLFLIGIALTLAFAMNAQKQMITSAWSYLKDGYLDDAKKAIDKAEANPQTAESFKTFWFKGQIYQEIGSSKNKKYQALCNDCYEVAYESYMKALKYNFVKAEHRDIDFTTQAGLMKFANILNQNNEANYESTEAFMDILFQRFPALSNAFVNKGINAFQSSDFETSYNQFEKAIQISTLTFRIDTQIYYYASLAAMRSKKFEEAISLNDFLIGANYGIDNKEKVSVYVNQAMALKETGDTAKMLKVLEDGIAKFPNDNYPLVIETYNYYIASGNITKANDYINIALEKDPNNSQLLLRRGQMYVDSNDYKSAEIDFQKVLDAEPDNYDAIFGMAAMYKNAFIEKSKYADDLPLSETEEYEKSKALANKYAKKSIVYLEQAFAMKNNDIPVLQSLKELYHHVGREEESQQMGARIKELTE
ncbi:MAG: tetratricopeptide repeat protein [Bacteroidales bacterium]|nr:tetratricopeptide repeat protein [Bacteroidales bacterium]